jgi:hypothetical protein
MKTPLYLLCLMLPFGSDASFFSRKEGVIFETKGEAVIIRSGTFTMGIERKNIPIPQLLDVRLQNEFSSLRHDNESGWTKCRVPLKGELGLTGVTERSLVFDCKPIQYFSK